MCAGGCFRICPDSGDQIFLTTPSGPMAPGTTPISEMGPEKFESAYIFYIGAGAVAAGGIISLIRSLPTILHGLREGDRKIFEGRCRRDHFSIEETDGSGICR